MLQIITVTTIITPLKLMLLYHPKFLREENSEDRVICKTLTFLCLMKVT